MNYYKSLLLIACLLIISDLSAQNDSIYQPDTIKMPNDQLIINLLSNTWLDAPENVKLMPVSIGCELYSMSPVFGKKKSFSGALGFGIGVNNVHLNSLPFDSLDATHFMEIPGGYEYTKNKITVAYADIPFELRYRTKPNIKKRNFKISVGGKFGYMISNYLKYKGQDFRNSSTKIAKFKEYNISNILEYRYSAYLRAGYGKINFIINYTLSPLFEKDKGPDVIPVSFGFSFTVI